MRFVVATAFQVTFLVMAVAANGSEASLHFLTVANVWGAAAWVVLGQKS